MLHIILGLLLSVGATSTPAEVLVPTIINASQKMYDNRPTTTPELIEFWANVYQVDGEKAKRIAKAESGYKEHAKNPNSSASGIFQIIKGTAKEFKCGDVFDRDENIVCAMKILKTSGDKHWNSSRSVWDK